MAEDNRPVHQQWWMSKLAHNGEAPPATAIAEGNPVGSRFAGLGNAEAAYMVGLWCADGYHRTSSIGLSNVDALLAIRMADFLAHRFGRARVRLRVYVPQGVERPVAYAKRIADAIVYRHVRKARHASYHVYVNSRPFLRQMRQWRTELDTLPEWAILPYLAGRFDGDGSVAVDGRQDLRIVYGTREEATRDLILLQRVRTYETRVYRYARARTWVLYCSRQDAPDLLNDLRVFSTKLRQQT